jgi:hypothetical protein
MKTEEQQYGALKACLLLHVRHYQAHEYKLTASSFLHIGVKSYHLIQEKESVDETRETDESDQKKQEDSHRQHYRLFLDKVNYYYRAIIGTG